jgi:biotin carboxyl carrier protein
MTNFQLPFTGEWFTYWGGDTREVNQHHDNPAQKYAFDFLILNNLNHSFKGKGLKNEDYFCFGQEIRSPAPGEVVQVIDGVDDNDPGYLNGYWVAGNTVIIKHSNSLYSFLAHFKQDSVAVKVGDKVKSGDLLGLCGNSGRSSEPHLHFHLQDKANTLFAKGIKCFFDEIYLIKDNQKEIVKKYSPVKRDSISNLV